MLIFFTLYSFGGWMIEVIFRSLRAKRFINPGFLYGPFVPVYGTGALFVIIIQQYISPLHLLDQFVIYTVLLSLIEYLTGEIFERFFGLKLWDYSDMKFNINGKVSLLFSIGWGALAMILSRIIHPAVSAIFDKLDFGNALIISIIMAGYFTADMLASIASLNRFRENLTYLYEKYSSLNSIDAQKIMASFQRFLDAFPNLNKYLNSNLSGNLKSRVNSMKVRFADMIESVLNDRKPDDDEYAAIVRDILDHPEFLKLKNFFHHNSSIYNHARVVSYISYKICRYLNLDHVSAARGGLLHDFFLYDWRNHREPELAKEKYHGLEHPKIALRNSLEYFELNEIEKDIILKHMWPLTMVPPCYQESFVVTFADKYVSSREFIDEFRKRRIKK